MEAAHGDGRKGGSNPDCGMPWGNNNKTHLHRVLRVPNIVLDPSPGNLFQASKQFHETGTSPAPLTGQEIHYQKGKTWPPPKGGWVEPGTKSMQASGILPQFSKLCSLSKPQCPHVSRQRQAQGKESINTVE